MADEQQEVTPAVAAPSAVALQAEVPQQEIVEEVATPAPYAQPEQVIQGVNPEQGQINSALFEADAFSILEKAQSYDEAMNGLSEAYKGAQWADPQQARDLYSEYGEAVRGKFRQKLYSPNDVDVIAPIKFEEVEPDPLISDKKRAALDKIDKWEQLNNEFLATTEDADYIAVKTALSNSLKRTASLARRDIKSEDVGVVEDHVNRILAGAADPFGANFGESTRPDLDDSYTGAIAQGAGQIGALIGASSVGALAGPPGALAAGLGVGALMGAEQVSDQYADILAETGSTRAATKAAAIESVSQALQMLPTGKAVAQMTSAVGRRVLGTAAKDGLEGVAGKIFSGVAVEASTEAGGQVLSNVARQVGLDEDFSADELLKGVAQSAVAGGLLGGAVEGIEGVSEGFSRDKWNAARTIYAARETMNEGPTSAPPAPTQNGAAPAVASIDDFFSRVEASSKPDVPAVEGLGVPLVPEAQTLMASAVPQTMEERVFGVRPPNFNEEQQAIGEDGNAVPRTESLEPDEQSVMQEATDINADEVKKPIKREEIETDEAVDISKVLADKPPKPDSSMILGADVGTINQHISGAPRPALRFVMATMRKLGAEIKTQNAIPGQYGNYNYGTNTVSFVKALGRDAKTAETVMAHEFMHWVDKVGKTAKGFEQEGLVQKFSRTKSKLEMLANQSKPITDMAAQISKFWRPGWNQDGSAHDKYRSAPAEIFADVMSAFVVRPDLFTGGGTGNLPPFAKMYAVMDTGMSSDPQLAGFWNTLKQMLTDPTLMDAFDRQKDAANRAAGGFIEEQRRTEQEAEDKGQFNKAAIKAWMYAADSFHSARKLAMSESDVAVRDEKLRVLDDMEDPSYFRMWLENTGYTPRQAAYKRLEAAGISMNQLSDYMRAQNLLSGTTRTMENIKEDPNKYLGVLEFFDTDGVLAKYIQTPETRSLIADVVSASEAGEIDTDKLTRALARIGLDLAVSEASMSARDERLLKEAKSETEREKIQRRINRKAQTRAENTGQSDAEVRLRDELESSGLEIPEEVYEVLKPTAFNTRRFLLNEYGDADTAKGDLERLERTLGPQKMQVLKEVNETVHQTLAAGMDILDQSGIFAPGVMDRIKLNQDSYVTSSVLKYFDGDKSIDASVKTAFGSLDATGAELPDTILKMNAIYSYAFRQQGKNSYLKFLQDSGIEVVKAEDAGEDIAPADAAEWSAKRENRSKDQWAMVTRDKGQPTVWIVKGRELAGPLRSIQDVPLLNATAIVIRGVSNFIEALNNFTLTRPLFTVLSLPFAVRQFRIDRKVETSMGSAAWWPTIMGFHTNPQLLKMQARGMKIIHKLMTGSQLSPEDLKLADELTENRVISRGEIEDTMPYGSDGAQREIDNLREILAKEAGTPLKLREIAQKSDRFARNAMKIVEDIPFLGAIPKYTRKFSLYGEQLTKMMGYMIARERLGMPPAAAVAFAKQNFGTPQGGGLLKREANAGFLFGRAGLLGHRNLARMFDPRKGRKLNVAGQVTMQAILPKLLVAKVVILPIIASMFGDEEAKKYEQAIDMIPSFDKINVNPLIIGFMDSNGNPITMDKVNLKDIKSDWKAWYIREPLTREMSTLANVFFPMIEDLWKGREATDVASGVANNAYQQAALGFTPFLQYFMNGIAIARGQNPWDSFRKKEIFRDSEFEKMNTLERAKAYLTDYAIPNQTKSILGFDPFKDSQDKENLFDKAAKIPVIGSLTKSLFGTSNYGLYEQGKVADADRMRLDKRIADGRGENTNLVIELVKKADQVGHRSKQTGNKINPEEQAAFSRARSFKANQYKYLMNEARNAYESGDMEGYFKVMQKMEQAASRVVEMNEKDSKESAKN